MEKVRIQAGFGENGGFGDLAGENYAIEIGRISSWG